MHDVQRHSAWHISPHIAGHRCMMSSVTARGTSRLILQGARQLPANNSCSVCTPTAPCTYNLASKDAAISFLYVSQCVCMCVYIHAVLCAFRSVVLCACQLVVLCACQLVVLCACQLVVLCACRLVVLCACRLVVLCACQLVVLCACRVIP